MSGSEARVEQPDKTPPESGPIDLVREATLPLVLERARRGRANRRKGATAEQQLAKWLRTHGWPDAERAEKNGWRTEGHVSLDPLDILNAGPGLAWSVKNAERERIDQWMQELDEKAGNRIGLLVVRRAGKADPGRWWCWMRLHALLDLAAPAPSWSMRAWVGWAGTPIRMELGHVVQLLVNADYGVVP